MTKYRIKSNKKRNYYKINVGYNEVIKIYKNRLKAVKKILTKKAGN